MLSLSQTRPLFVPLVEEGWLNHEVTAIEYQKSNIEDEDGPTLDQVWNSMSVFAALVSLSELSGEIFPPPCTLTYLLWNIPGIQEATLSFHPVPPNGPSRRTPKLKILAL